MDREIKDGEITGAPAGGESGNDTFNAFAVERMHANNHGSSDRECEGAFMLEIRGIWAG